MKITENTRVSDILKEYGDIADVMELFGVKRVGRFSLRALVAKMITVKWAAKIHHMDLDKFLEILEQAVQSKDKAI